jgi:hypothetical protein
MRRPALRLLTVVLSSAAVGLVLAADIDGPVRLAISVWFLLVVPGLAYAPMLPPLPGPPRAALVLALSLAIDTAVTTALLVVGELADTAALLALVGVALVGSGLEIRRWPRALVWTDVHLHVPRPMLSALAAGAEPWPPLPDARPDPAREAEAVEAIRATLNGC